jgi:hypothetical protein
MLKYGMQIVYDPIAAVYETVCIPDAEFVKKKTN